MHDATRVSFEAPIFGLEDGRGTCFPEEAASPCRDPPTERSPPEHGARALAVPVDVAQGLEQYRRLAESVVRRCGVPRREAPDVVQELLIRLLPRWSGGQGCAPDKPREYVIGAARTEAKRYHRERRVRAEVLRPNDAIPMLLVQSTCEQTPEPTAEDVMILAEMRAELASELALHVLEAATTAERWSTFRAYVLEDLPAARIAEREGLPIGTIYTRIRLARRDLRGAIVRARAKMPPR